MLTKLESSVPGGVNGMRVATYLDRAYPMLGRVRINKLLSARQVKLNGERAGGEALVSSGDTIVCYLEGKYDLMLRIIYSDAHMLCFAKPAGLPVDKDDMGIGEDTVLSRLKLINPDARLVHRLDTGTAGVMLAALDEDAEKELVRLFREHLVEKHYSATVTGRMPEKHGTIRGYITKDAKQSRVKAVSAYSSGALEAETRYSVRKEYKQQGILLSVLDITIPTGRTHQIRAQLSSIGHPLLGDDKYGDRDINRRLNKTETDLTSEKIIIRDCEAAGRYRGLSFSLVKPEE